MSRAVLRARIFCKFFATCALLGPVAASAQTIRLVTVSDSRDATIGHGAAENAKLVHAYFSQVAGVLGVPLTRIDVTEREFTCSNIRSALRSLPAASEDVVVFHYSGHGYRSDANLTKFPELYCGPEAYQGESIKLVDVTEELQRKGARMTLVVADACNVVVPGVPGEPLGGVMSVPGGRADQFRKLFLKHRGVVTLSGAVKDQYSWYLPSGGHFTTQLLRALNEASAPGRTVEWSEVLDVATRQISIPVSGVSIPQKPERDGGFLPIP